MSLFIKSIYGATSVGTFELTGKRYVFIGSSSDSEIVLHDEGLPELACIVETNKTGIIVRCKSGAGIRLNGRVLKKDEAVEWEVGTIMDISGAVKLTLMEEQKESTRQGDRRNASSSRTMEFSTPPKYTQTSKNTRKSPRDATVSQGATRIDPRQTLAETMARTYGGAREYENEGEVKKSRLLPLLVIIFCVIGFIFILLLSGNFVPNEETPVAALITYNKLLKENNSEVRKDFEKLAQSVKISYLKEKSNPYLALIAYNSALEEMRRVEEELIAKKNNLSDSDEAQIYEKSIETIKEAEAFVMKHRENMVNLINGN